MNKHIGEEGNFPASPFPLSAEKIFLIFFCAFDKFYEIINMVFSNLQSQMSLNSLFHLFRLDTDIPLCHSGAAVLEKLLN